MFFNDFHVTKQATREFYENMMDQKSTFFGETNKSFYTWLNPACPSGSSGYSEELIIWHRTD